METTSSPTNETISKSLRGAITSNMTRLVAETTHSLLSLGLLRSLWSFLRLLSLFRLRLRFNHLFWSTLPTDKIAIPHPLLLFRVHLLGTILRHMSSLTAVETSTWTAETTALRDKMLVPRKMSLPCHKSLSILLRGIILLWAVASKMSRFLANIAQTLRRFL